MTETVVHVTTLDEWKSVLNVWFKQGYAWPTGDKEYSESIFEDGGRFLFLDNCITYSRSTSYSKPFIEYSEFMAQQKEDKEVKTYYVTQEQLRLIEELKNHGLPFYNLVNSTTSNVRLLAERISDELDRPLLRYLGGDETIEFKVKEPLYRLWLIDDAGDKLFFWIDDGRPDWVGAKDEAFTATLDEIKKWQTPAWEIEKVD